MSCQLQHGSSNNPSTVLLVEMGYGCLNTPENIADKQEEANSWNNTSVFCMIGYLRCLSFLSCTYPLCFYTPILASSKSPPTKCPFLLMSTKPVTVHTALLHLFFASAIGLVTPLQPPECHQWPWGFSSPTGEKQRLVWLVDGPSPQPKQQTSWRRSPLAAPVAAADQDVWGGKNWWTGERQAVGSQHASFLPGKGLNRWTHNKSMLLGLGFFLVMWSFPLGCSALLH